MAPRLSRGRFIVPLRDLPGADVLQYLIDAICAVLIVGVGRRIRVQLERVLKSAQCSEAHAAAGRAASPVDGIIIEVLDEISFQFLNTVRHLIDDFSPSFIDPFCISTRQYHAGIPSGNDICNGLPMTKAMGSVSGQTAGPEDSNRAALTAFANMGSSPKTREMLIQQKTVCPEANPMLPVVGRRWLIHAVL